MRARIYLALLAMLLVLLLIGACPAQTTGINADLQSALDSAKISGKLLIVDFYGAWCPWCVKMDETLADAGVKDLLNQKYYYYKLDVGNFDKHTECLSQYKIEAIPYMIVFDANGAVKGTCEGFKEPAAFKDFLNNPTIAVKAPASDNPWTDEEKAITLLRGYFERMKLEATRDETQKYPVFTAPVKKTNATHRIRCVIDVKRQVVYVFLNRYLQVKPDSPVLPKVLQRLMEENWNLNIGKFEWDKSDGEIRLSYCFTTENGLGYESFEAIVNTLLDSGDKLWPELNTLAQG
jgi:thioredoxin-related protein